MLQCMQMQMSSADVRLCPPTAAPADPIDVRRRVAGPLFSVIIATFIRVVPIR
jgi:hypothetical protein